MEHPTATRVRLRGQAGFSMLEILVVITLLGVLGGAAILGIGSLRGEAQAATCDNSLNTVRTAVEAFRNGGSQPADLQALYDAELLKDTPETTAAVDVNNGVVTGIGVCQA